MSRLSRHLSIYIVTDRLLLGLLAGLVLACGGDDSDDIPAILRGVECVRPSETNPLGGPGVWDGVIASYERADVENPPPDDPIVFIGSSSIALWSTLVEDMAPLPALNRGFGGSVMAQAVGYVERIVTPYRPRAVVLYEGDNDIGFGLSAECVLEDFDRFVAAVRADDIEVPIYFLSIKPSLARAPLWSEMVRANALIEARAGTSPTLHYIDVATPLLDDAGDPRADVFLDDGLHLNSRGYREWTTVVRPMLLEAFPTQGLGEQ